VLTTENNQKSPKTTKNCRKQQKTANQKTKVLPLTSQTKLTLTVTLTLTDTVTLTSQTKLTENNLKQTKTKPISFQLFLVVFSV